MNYRCTEVGPERFYVISAFDWTIQMCLLWNYLWYYFDELLRTKQKSGFMHRDN